MRPFYTSLPTYLSVLENLTGTPLEFTTTTMDSDDPTIVATYFLQYQPHVSVSIEHGREEDEDTLEMSDWFNVIWRTSGSGATSVRGLTRQAVVELYNVLHPERINEIRSCEVGYAWVFGDRNNPRKLLVGEPVVPQKLLLEFASDAAAFFKVPVPDASKALLWEAFLEHQIETQFMATSVEWSQSSKLSTQRHGMIKLATGERVEIYYG